MLGMETVRALVDAGLLVAAYQRGETFDIPEMFHDDIEEMGWDVIDVTTVKKVLDSNPFEAVVCTVGGGITRPDFDKDVPVKLVNAAKTAGVKRFVLVSSIGASDGVKDVDEMTLKEVAEEAVKSSELNYTIIRPGGLLSTPPTGNGILTENSGISGLISRADVASLIMEVLFNKNSSGKTLTAIDEDKLLPPTSSLDGVELISL